MMDTTISISHTIRPLIYTSLTILLSYHGLYAEQRPSPVFIPPHYHQVPLGAIRPEGWLRAQLTRMKNGSTANLDETFPKLSRDNGWLGGKGDDWEETPYWLDGAVPLAYLRGDTVLQRKVSKYIEWTIANQRPSGFFGPYTKQELEGKSTSLSPENGADWWPRMVMLKVLQQYYSATGDQRVIDLMTKYFRYQLANLEKCPLNKWSEWSSARGGDNLMIVYWLYGITRESFLLDLGKLLYEQTTPWTKLLGARNWVMEAAAQQNGERWMERHGVNVAMGLKLPAIYYQGSGQKAYLDSLHTGYRDLMLLHGLANGMFSSDEDLHGNLPSQGSELCAVVETMFSLQQVIAVTGDHRYADQVERLTFNVLPAQTSDDLSQRQYFQVANQVAVRRGVSHFTLPFDQGMNNVFGPYAGYTCCTSNMHQGWPKFAESLWYQARSGGVAAMMYAPNTITIKNKDNSPIVIREVTNYPFDEEVKFLFEITQSVNFPLELRIPSWCKHATVSINGQAAATGTGGNMIVLNRKWKNNDLVTLRLPMEVTMVNGARNSRTAERGPLIYAFAHCFRGKKRFPTAR